MSHSRRVFVDFPEKPLVSHGTSAQLSAEDARHFVSVLRLKTGDEITAVDRRTAKEYSSIISSILGNQVTIQVLAERLASRLRSPVSSLSMGLAKGDKCDFICEKCCELGVANVVFWQSERSIVRVSSPADCEKKLARWRKVAESAAKQSGNDHITKVHLVLDQSSLFRLLDSLSTPEDRRLICSLTPGAPLPFELQATKAAVHLAVGPEGDFSPAEESAFSVQGFTPMSLGPLVLRCETAAVVAVSMIHGVWGFQST